MNRNKSFTSATLLLLLFFIISGCSKKGVPPSLLFRIVTVEKSSSPEKADPQCSISFEYPQFAQKVAIVDTLNSYIERLFYSNFQLKSGDIQQLSSNLLEEYRVFTVARPDRASSWDYQANCKIVHETPEVISLSGEFYAFTGGAHGLYNIFYSSFDKKKATRIQIGDIINKSEFGTLTAIAESIFRQNQNLEAGQSLSEAGYWFENDQFFLPNNFALLKKGLIFFYNPYEIAPYVAGSFEVLLPYEKINSLLLAPFAK